MNVSLVEEFKMKQGYFIFSPGEDNQSKNFHKSLIEYLVENSDQRWYFTFYATTDQQDSTGGGFLIITMGDDLCGIPMLGEPLEYFTSSRSYKVPSSKRLNLDLPSNPILHR